MSFFYNFFLNIKLFQKKFSSKKNYYSFSGVDTIIENIFRTEQKGFYVDVGCQHPIRNNNTYLLYKKGWYGLNIDLDKDNIDLFNVSRPNDDNINIAISNKIGKTDLYFYHKKSAGPVSFAGAIVPDQPTEQATIMNGARQLQMGQHHQENGYKPAQIPTRFQHLRRI